MWDMNKFENIWETLSQYRPCVLKNKMVPWAQSFEGIVLRNVKGPKTQWQNHALNLQEYIQLV